MPISNQGISAVLLVTGPATAAVTTTLWIYEITSKLWVPWRTGTVTTYGTPQFIEIPAQAKIYPQISAVANAPTGFVLGFLSKG